MTTVIAILATALLLSLAQTWWALTHHDEHGNPIGLHIYGVPIDFVLGAAFLSLGSWLLDGVRADLATGIGIGALASYACTWGKAIGYSAIAVRQPIPPQSPDDE